jgi:protocatechuate 3,4-dioxygenase beta subunit
VKEHRIIDRRRFVGLTSAAAAIAALPWRVDASGRVVTPPQAVGPFYPRERPAEADNDLVSVRGAAGTAKGEVTELTGIVTGADGRPVAGARVEIWQCNAFGRYHHPGDNSSAPLDPNFQGYGETVTDAAGAYRFRTIKPVPYPGRAPHIHVRVTARGFATISTQMYVAGEPQNDRDFLLQSVRDPEARAKLVVPFRRGGEGAAPAAKFDAKFDIVLAAA